MKFSCEQSTLIKALNTVSRAVTSRSTLPILKGILLNVNDGKLTMASSDLEISIEKKIDVLDFEEGSLVVQAKLFSDIIRKLPNELVYINEENNNILIKCGNSEYQLVGDNADEFPNIIVENEDNGIAFNKDTLKDMIDKTSYAASIDEARGVITGCLIELRESTLRMVSLDGFRMAVTEEVMKNNEDKDVIISAKILNEVSKIIMDEGEDNDVILHLGNKKATFIISNTKVVVSLLDGTFTRYNDILPKNQSIFVNVNRIDLANAIERVSLFSKIGKNNLIKMDIKDDSLQITSKSEEGNGKEEVIITKEGDNLTIGFNSKYLIDALKVIDDDEIKLEFNNPLSPLLITPITGNSYKYLVLPVKIRQN